MEDVVKVQFLVDNVSGADAVSLELKNGTHCTIVMDALPY